MLRLLVVVKLDTTTNRNEYAPDMGIRLLCPAIF